ncbi:MAG TPA: Na+/H+ antiporter NhaA [Gaiellaceae bacterium]|nr:Na+/H+ antiporter NhaA [Gaiellaceae bacterium]
MQRSIEKSLLSTRNRTSLLRRRLRRAWPPWRRPVPRLAVPPLERFLRHEASSASLLIVAAAAALLWANLAGDSYERVWTAAVRLEVAGFTLEEDTGHLVNELLMAVFFYVVALEVKRELLFGALRDVRTAAVPVAAAFGTMVGAAAAYIAINSGGDLRGWAIPIATDIAFALGVLGLAGRRAPRELRVFMLILAVVDDLVTIAVIAIAFTDDLSLAWLAAAAGLVLVVAASARAGIGTLALYVPLAGGIWLAVFESGIHATLAGVALGFLTPATARSSAWAAGRAVRARLSAVPAAGETAEGALLEATQLAANSVSPLRRMEHGLTPWSAYAILPLFALANAGVPLSLGGVADALTTRIGLGIALGLVVGAPLGGILFAWLVVRVGVGRMPQGLDWPAVAGVAPLKGIGFTIAIFISGLSFNERPLQEQATLAVLVASVAAAFLGLTVLHVRYTLVTRRRGRPARE